MAYISEYGNWGNEEILVVDEGTFTSEQWQRIEDLPDNDKLKYARAIIEGLDLSEWEA